MEPKCWMRSNYSYIIHLCNGLQLFSTFWVFCKHQFAVQKISPSQVSMWWSKKLIKQHFLLYVFVHSLHNYWFYFQICLVILGNEQSSLQYNYIWIKSQRLKMWLGLSIIFLSLQKNQFMTASFQILLTSHSWSSFHLTQHYTASAVESIHIIK
jgi:hypothetical protein